MQKATRVMNITSLNPGSALEATSCRVLVPTGCGLDFILQ